ncbi:hypothetical protein Tco_0557254 [Tanacetum coccineum]
MSFSKRPGKNTPQCYTKPLDSLKNWNNRFFWVDERIFLTVVEWRTSAPKDKMPSADSYSAADVTTLDTHRTPIKKQPELLLCLVGLSRSYFLGDDVAPNPTKVKTGTRPRAAHEVPLLTVTASRVIEMEDTDVASGSSGTPFALEKSPLDLANEDPSQMITDMGREADQVHDGLSHEIPPVETATTTKGNDEAEANAPPKVLRKDHAAFRPVQSTLEGKSLALMVLEAGSTFFTPATQETPTDAKSMSDPEQLSYAEPQPHLEQDVAQSSKKTAPEIRTENVATAGVQDLLSTESLGSGKSTYVLSVGGSPGSIYQPGWGVTNNCRLDTPDACQDMVVIGSQLRLRFEQEVKLLKKAKAEIARRDQRIQAENLETLLEAEVFVDVVSAGIAKGMSEGIKHGIEHGKANLDLAAIEVYDPKANTKYVAALHALKDLKYPLVDQLEKLKDAPIDLIMASLYLESDSGKDAPQWIRELRPSSSQLKIHVYPEVRDPKDPWSFKEEMLLEDAIAANISRAEKKKKCRVVCRTHRVGSAHHARSDGVPVSVPTVAPQGLAILLADAATQTQTSEDEASPRLLRSKSLPPMYNLDWP